MLNSIEESIKDIQKGKIIIIIDDEKRENEGDFVASAELITPEIINFMSLEGRGLICVPIPEKRCRELSLDLMVKKNTDPNKTAFTVSIDLIRNDITTGISAFDRSKTIQAIMNSKTTPYDFTKPGHVFPLQAKNNGVLSRPGHTEAAVDLSILAGLKPGGVIVEIMNKDGRMARLKDLIEISKKFNIKIISIKDLIQYRIKNESSLAILQSFKFCTILSKLEFIIFFEKINQKIYFVLKIGKWNISQEVLLYVLSSSLLNEVFTKFLYGKNINFKKLNLLFNKKNQGVIIFVNDKNNIENILETIKSYLDKKNMNLVFIEEYKKSIVEIKIIKNLGIKKIKLIN